MAAAEALACGLPAVMFDLPPLRVTYPLGVLKAPIGDEASCARHVLRLLRDETTRKALGEQARKASRAWDRALRAREAMSFVDRILEMEPIEATRRKTKAPSARDAQAGGNA